MKTQGWLEVAPEVLQEEGERVRVNARRGRKRMKSPLCSRKKSVEPAKISTPDSTLKAKPTKCDAT